MGSLVVVALVGCCKRYRVHFWKEVDVLDIEKFTYHKTLRQIVTKAYGCSLNVFSLVICLFQPQVF